MAANQGNTSVTKNIVVLCVLSPMRFYEERDYRVVSNNAFAGVRFSGAQTNEAPVEYLISEAYDATQGVSASYEIIYLCSGECRKADIAFDDIAGLLPEGSASAQNWSAEDLFCERIDQYCSDKGISVEYTPIDYDPSLPADSLAEIAKYLGSSFRVSIDLTGGPRDAAVLMTLAAEIVKFNAADNEIGPIVYSNRDEGTITDQRESFSLVDLASAVNEFTQFGSADGLCEFFGVDGKSDVGATQETQEVCRAMRSLADDLTLCKVTEIEKRVYEVQESLTRAQSKLEEMGARFELASRALQYIDNPSLVGYSNSFETVSLIEQEPLAGLLGLSGVEELLDLYRPDKLDYLRSSLNEVKMQNTIARPELLFAGLIETIRQKLSMPGNGSMTDSIVGIIQWCVNRNMIMQALAIFCEKLSDYLTGIGCFRIDYRAYANVEKEIGQSICKACRFTKKKSTRLEKPYTECVIIVHPTDSVFREAIAWFKLLVYQRNKIIHVDAHNRKLHEESDVKEILGKTSIEVEPTVSGLKTDLNAALKCLRNLAGK